MAEAESTVRTVIRLVSAVLLGWATYVLTASALDTKVKLVFLTVVAALAVAASAVVQFLNGADLLLSGDRNSVGAQLNSLLQDKLVHAYDEGLIGGDITQVSAHIWEVPAAYRRLIPINFRRLLRRIFSVQVQKYAWRPKLHRVARFNLRQLPPTGISFRKGKGIIGAALVINDSHIIQIVDFRDPVFLAALADSNGWDDKPISVTRHLEHWEAERLASRYDQALAVVIQDSRSGEAIGALTLEVSGTIGKQLQDNEPLLRMMRELAVLVGPILAKS